jgi:phenylalanyl-tRNA synthetase beta chain
MHISINWIRQHCPFQTDESPARIGERFSLATAEVEGVESRGEDAARYVAARVVEVAPIAGTDGRLKKVLVDAGQGRPLTVVCGAPAVELGMVAPLALPGVRVRGEAIEASTIRGVVSEGMLLAEDEAGVSSDHGGLMLLPQGIPPGTPLDRVYPSLRDVVLEVDNKSLTHRPDLWGHYGIAREFSSIYGVPLRPYAVDESLAAASGDPVIRVSIESGEAARRCRRYCGLRIDNVRVGPSPDWLRHLLFAVGSRPINNIVDVTNYVLFDLGQPLHAFDTARVEAQRIVVRMPKRGEKLKLLDASEVALDAEDLVIADGARPVALAGVMGGEDSGITDATTSIFLEAANFDPVSVRRSSLRHTRTESSARFEKSLDPYNARLGILKAAQLVLELCPGARVVGPLQDVGFRPPAPIVIEIGPGFIAERLGADLGEPAVRDILTRLGFEVGVAPAGAKAGQSPAWRVRVPSWRATRDISIKEDLVEEIGRIHGYGRIEPYAPSWPVAPPQGNPRRALERRIKGFLTSKGLTEVYTYSMVGEAHCKLFGLDPGAHLRIINPTSEDLDRLRRELVPIHLEKARDNQRFLSEFAFFEIGRVYRKSPGTMREPLPPAENVRIAGVFAFADKRPENFYELKGVLLELIDAIEVDCGRVQDSKDSAPWAHPSVGAVVCLGDRPVGSFYRIHPVFTRRLDLRGDVFAFDLDADALCEAPQRERRYRKLPRFPGVPFDVAVVAAERTPAARIIELIRAAGGPLIRSVEVFDVYRGPGVEEGKKSIALQMVFRADERTLGADEVSALQNAVLGALESAGFPLRR